MQRFRRLNRSRALQIAVVFKLKPPALSEGSQIRLVMLESLWTWPRCALPLAYLRCQLPAMGLGTTITGDAWPLQKEILVTGRISAGASVSAGTKPWAGKPSEEPAGAKPMNRKETKRTGVTTSSETSKSSPQGYLNGLERTCFARTRIPCGH